VSEEEASSPLSFSADELKQGERWFRQDCVFVAGAATTSRIPEPDLPEIAFAGRSNVGKSSLINALTFRKGLARASNTPGRTQQIKFFNLGGQMNLVDLTCYGYAVDSKSKVQEWGQMITDYLRTRETLKCVVVLVDSRHGLKPTDHQIMQMLDSFEVPFVVVMTKGDKLNRYALADVHKAVGEGISVYPSAFDQVFPTSAEKQHGMPELRAFLSGL